MSIVQHYTIWHENESTKIVRVSPIQNEQIVANICKYDFFTHLITKNGKIDKCETLKMSITYMMQWSSFSHHPWLIKNFQKNVAV
jgi:hypothetical protein